MDIYDNDNLIYSCRGTGNDEGALYWIGGDNPTDLFSTALNNAMEQAKRSILDNKSEIRTLLNRFY